MRKIYLFVAIAVFSGCINESFDSVYSLKTISKVDDLNSKRKEFYESGKLKEARDTSNLNDYGNRYEFYETGILKSYSFQMDSIYASYIVKFDSLGNIKSVEGGPMVTRIVSADESPDSLYVWYYLTDIPKRTNFLFLSDDGINFKQVALQKDEKMAFIRKYLYKKYTRDVQRFLLIAKIESTSPGRSKEIYMDTVDLTRNKQPPPISANTQ